MEHRTVIDASKKGLNLNIKELFAFKDLFWILAYRDVKVRYAQTYLGFLWALIQPFTTVLIFTLVFKKVAKIDTGNVPYPLFSIVGMFAWSYFSNLVSSGGSSIVSAQNMIQKIYFPRLIIPFSKAIVGLVDMGIMSLAVIMLMFVYQFTPSANIIFLPFFLFVAIICGLGAALWISALSVRYRDFQNLVPYIIQFGLYFTPIAYPTNALPEKIKPFVFLNPMAGVVEGFRWSILGTEAPDTYTYISCLMVFIFFIGGLYYFRKVEKIMADII